MTPSELRRLYSIVRVLLSYGLDELIPKMRLTLPLRAGRRLLFWLPNRHRSKPLGERLRLALQELGPVWIKFGQMMSTRRDLFPPAIADQLAMLQDKVEPFDGKLAREQIELSMGGIPLEEWFDDFDIKPLASASIAQVHTACLKSTGKEIVIKVIRPDILPVIKADMRLMKRLAGWLPHLLPDGRRLRPREVVLEYEKTLLDELNLLREAANAIQLRRNFENSPMLYVPEVYSDYCSESMLVMERIYGIPVSDVDALTANGTDMKLLAERGVQVFFTQVFRDSFFHADMHPGNIFISYEHPEDPQYIGIDCGIVGSLNKEDKRYLAENFIAFFNRDYRKVAELHVDSGWVPPDTNVADFEFAIRTVCEPIFEKPLAEISFGHVLLNLFNTARRFNMEVQPQLVLLQKTLLYVEGVGRQLYPQLDLWKTAKPFLENWLKQQVGLPAVFRALKEKAPFWAEKLPEVPELFYDGLRQHKMLKQSVDQLAYELKTQQSRQGQSRYLLGIGATLLISGTLLLISRVEADMIPSGLMAAGIVAWIIGWRRTR
ncbi:ubiquinone biosynthesis regulatory protein kinase UbiB [Pectobacterium carotovorum]|uniref:ubiquinone biosynthesis regulatory protein kinase UbiB n=1 Tax=Pectobacterium carotovorum TaxID=554 RepID=UPI0001A431E7|nr:ubiquinone biosynthesis regulatory protein kinase UbiB [Pectobacterium carotovorum]KAA3669479.1 ubiquinone biosynthesis regulatory protein kinase UbiB [Pectobacterium carotovorum subsp. carotovorum]KFW98749.1 ubiquinone biosynthesis protein UbiB [Pectobacterium carotovorum subsp. carotovorum]KHS83040.1 ubiquinone biosynthesis protein UbiB [Pectobacterium carotovorum subsp. carotovorum]KHT20463.1 ubiquinone biosynthesis protein UbiB [Pectobacterium carotovorum subsp. carotovorum]KHT25003.1 u